MITSLVPGRTIVHSIPIAMSVISFLRFPLVFSTMPFESCRASASATRSTPAPRQRRPTSFPRFVLFITVHTSVGSPLFPNVLSVVLPRPSALFVVPSSGRAPWSFTLPSYFLPVWAFVAAVRVTPTGIVGTDWYAVTSRSAPRATTCWTLRTAPRAAIDRGMTAAPFPAD